MINTSANFKTEINKPSRSFECKVTIGNHIYTNKDIVNIVLDYPQSQEGFSIGNTISQSLDLTLINTKDIIFSTSQVKVEIGLKVGSTIEYIPMGIFNIDEIEKTDYTTKLTCYDNMIKFAVPYFSELSDKPTLQQVVDELSSKTGVKFVGNLPAYTVSKLDGFTCREVLSYVASICAGNAVITRDGNFTIKTLKEVTKTIDGNNYFDYKKEDMAYKISKISCSIDEKNLSKGTLGADSMELQISNPWINETILTEIYNKLNGLTYLGYSMKWQGDLSLEQYDVITVTDTKNVTRKIPILAQKFNYTGGLTAEIEAKGESKNKNSFSSSGGGNTVNKVNKLVTEQAIIKEALIDKATIKDLTALSIKTETLEAKTAKIENLLAGNISGENIQAGGITSDKLTIANGFIKNAMIANLDVAKINAGDISTNKFRIVSNSGKMLIADNTIQIRDNDKARVQIGKDASNDYSMYVWDKSGKLMFDATGLKADGIKDSIIRDDMISDDANIDGSKINIGSLVTEINKDTNTSVIKSSKIQLDTAGQTLDIIFNTLKSQVDGVKDLTESNSTTIGAMQGQISTAINNTQIVKDGKVVLLKDDYNRTVAKVNSINSTIGSQTTTLDQLTGKITNVDTKVNSVKRDLEGTTTTVSSHSSTISKLDGNITSLQSRVNTAEQKITATAILNAVNEQISKGGAISTTSTKLEKGKFTIYNGALIVKNNKSKDVMWCNTEGWLTASNLFINGNENPSNLEIGGSNGNKGVGIRTNGSNYSAYLDFGVLDRNATFAENVRTGKYHRFITEASDRTMLNLVTPHFNVRPFDGYSPTKFTVQGYIEAFHDISTKHNITATGKVTAGGFYKSNGYFAITSDTIDVLKHINGSKPYIEVRTPKSGTWGITIWASDKKLKENISKIDLKEKLNIETEDKTQQKIGLDLINNMNHYSFDYVEKFGGGHVSCGYVAQELQDLNSDLVLEVEQEDGSTMLQPSVQDLIPNITLALKQQQKIIEDLKAEIEELKSKIRA